ncbi:hypothetical protein GGR54DRAFT_257032 [Hypoxylon sp. NC1633]|nr:hypothetical protein GGR54DRAFT_257032 [Hypoxylon sp. NC1633]
MRSATLLIHAALCCSVGAEWLSWSGGGDGQHPSSMIARETGIVADETRTGSAPEPTEPPRALDSVQARDQVWTNTKTCGFYTNGQFNPFTCEENGTCTTNDNEVVACATGTSSPFYTACIDYAAYQGGECMNILPGTGCCMNPEYSACQTIVWSDNPHRSMLRCGTTAYTVTLLAVPLSVVEASVSSEAAASTLASTSSHPHGDVSTDKDSDYITQYPPINQGALIGGAVGGVVLMAIVGWLTLYCTKRQEQTRLDHEVIQERLNSVFQYSPQLESSFNPADSSAVTGGSRPNPATPSRAPRPWRHDPRHDPRHDGGLPRMPSTPSVLPNSSSSTLGGMIHTRIHRRNSLTAVDSRNFASPTRSQLSLPLSLTQTHHSTPTPPPAYEMHHLYPSADPQEMNEHRGQHGRYQYPNQNHQSQSQGQSQSQRQRQQEVSPVTPAFTDGPTIPEPSPLTPVAPSRIGVQSQTQTQAQAGPSGSQTPPPAYSRLNPHQRPLVPPSPTTPGTPNWIPLGYTVADLAQAMSGHFSGGRSPDQSFVEQFELQERVPVSAVGGSAAAGGSTGAGAANGSATTGAGAAGASTQVIHRTESEPASDVATGPTTDDSASAPAANSMPSNPGRVGPHGRRLPRSNRRRLRDLK